MGIHFSSIHILGCEPKTVKGFTFQSFSDGWLTCTNLDPESIDRPVFETAREISKNISEIVLEYTLTDSDEISFYFYQNGACVADYHDDDTLESKRTTTIPRLLGYDNSAKKRFSSILDHDDGEEKTFLLEEFFGVCLLPFSDLFTTPQKLIRKKSDTLYQEFCKQQAMMSKNAAPFIGIIVAQYHGKLFWNEFGIHTMKDHCYLFGFNDPISEMTPVRFCGLTFQRISEEEFLQDHHAPNFEGVDWHTEYEKRTYIVFHDTVPEPYKNKRLLCPKGYYHPLAFDSKNRFVFAGKKSVCLIDENGHIIAKIPIKGEVCDMVGDFVLTTTGDSFCGYEYDPKATIRIYQLAEQ